MLVHRDIYVERGLDMGLASVADLETVFRIRKLTPAHPSLRGRAWEIRDNERLVAAIAALALGQWRHVEQMLVSDATAPALRANYAIDGAIRSLSVEDGKDPWHRDGWLFQLISWIVAVEDGKGHPVRAPQMDQASKGFDGMQLILNRTRTRVKRMIVFEDKATIAPRDTVRDDVWPSFVLIEAGEREPALAAEVASLLDRVPQIDPIEAVNQIMRNPSARAFRVSITTGSYHARAEGFNGLFDGYEQAVKGGRSRRHANVFEVEDLRQWMADISARAVELLESQRVV